MEKVAKFPDLLKPSPLLKKAVKRYILFMENEEFCAGSRVPFDVAWIWCCHCLNPIVYFEDMHQLGGKIRDLFKPKGEIITLVDQNMENLVVKLDDSVEPKGKFKPSMNLEEASIRQRSFVTNSKFLWDANEKLCIKLRDQYVKFLKLIKIYGSSQTLVPTIGIDLIWHTHMLTPSAYKHDCEKHIGWILNHDDSIPNKKLTDSLEQTEKLWKKNFGKNYLNSKDKEKHKNEQAQYKIDKAAHEEKKKKHEHEKEESEKEKGIDVDVDVDASPPEPSPFPKCGGVLDHKHSHSPRDHHTISPFAPVSTPHSTHSESHSRSLFSFSHSHSHSSHQDSHSNYSSYSPDSHSSSHHDSHHSSHDTHSSCGTASYTSYDTGSSSTYDTGNSYTYDTGGSSTYDTGSSSTYDTGGGSSCGGGGSSCGGGGSSCGSSCGGGGCGGD